MSRRSCRGTVHPCHRNGRSSVWYWVSLVEVTLASARSCRCRLTWPCHLDRRNSTICRASAVGSQRTVRRRPSCYSCGIFLRNIGWGRGQAACPRPPRGGVWSSPAAPVAGQGRPKAGPKDRAAPLTRPPSGVGSAGWPRQRPVRGRVQGPGRGAEGEAVPTPVSCPGVAGQRDVSALDGVRSLRSA